MMLMVLIQYSCKRCIEELSRMPQIPIEYKHVT